MSSVEAEDDEWLVGSAEHCVFADLVKTEEMIRLGCIERGLRIVDVRSQLGVECGYDGIGASDLLELLSSSGSRFVWFASSFFDYARMLRHWEGLIGLDEDARTFAHTLEVLDGARICLFVEWQENGERISFRVVADWVKTIGGFPDDILGLFEKLGAAEAFGATENLESILKDRVVELGQWLEAVPEYRANRVGRDAIGSVLLADAVTKKDALLGKDRLIRMTLSEAKHLWNAKRRRAFEDIDDNEMKNIIELAGLAANRPNRDDSLLAIKDAMRQWSGGYPPTNDEAVRVFLSLE